MNATPWCPCGPDTSPTKPGIFQVKMVEHEDWRGLYSCYNVVLKQWGIYSESPSGASKGQFLRCDMERFEWRALA